MQFLMDILSNYCLMSAAASWLIAQLLKTVVLIVQNRKFSFVSLIASGGMPSSHSASVTALATSVGIAEGFASPVFAVTVLFAFIVMYDATGVRRETGRQAQVLNRLMADLEEGKSENLPAHLKELVGHSPLQVFAGAGVGILIAILLNMV